MRRYYALPPGQSTNDVLKAIFRRYAPRGRLLDNAGFAKLCRQSPGGLYTETLTTTDADIIFAHAVPHGERRMDYNHFLEGLAEVALRKYPDASPMTAFAMLLIYHIFGLLVAEDDGDNDDARALQRVLADLNAPPYTHHLVTSLGRTSLDGRDFQGHGRKLQESLL
ncbi:hypothetical protein CTAYLR_005307 [Chrysophaeum taylorii]|uniref:Uncharacterized protein n=1 Tax=Chrysophaeum taylorii TaxID=2483200 RepID=A0AAD7XS82_9STRA|nr:hypothetical protein CTAYLR_005307 [Chrysophaeum taylorii]